MKFNKTKLGESLMREEDWLTAFSLFILVVRPGELNLFSKKLLKNGAPMDTLIRMIDSMLNIYFNFKKVYIVSSYSLSVRSEHEYAHPTSKLWTKR